MSVRSPRLLPVGVALLAGCAPGSSGGRNLEELLGYVLLVSAAYGAVLVLGVLVAVAITVAQVVVVVLNVVRPSRGSVAAGFGLGGLQGLTVLVGLGLAVTLADDPTSPQLVVQASVGVLTNLAIAGGLIWSAVYGRRTLAAARQSEQSS